MRNASWLRSLLRLTRSKKLTLYYTPKGNIFIALSRNTEHNINFIYKKKEISAAPKKKTTRPNLWLKLILTKNNLPGCYKMYKWLEYKLSNWQKATTAQHYGIRRRFK